MQENWYKRIKNLALGVDEMYIRMPIQKHFDCDEFRTFDVTLEKENRWVQMGDIIPWNDFEEGYAKNFKKYGEIAFPLRVALGALIIQAKLGLTDEETVCQIAENPYMQYFLGFKNFKAGRPFHQSQMTYFRKRIPSEAIMKINDAIAGKASAPEKKEEEENAGELIIDATCAPSDMRFPTDTRLLNEARENLEDIIDTLHKPDTGKKRKPRTYRVKAKRIHVILDKQRKKTSKAIRKTIKKQLSFVKRDLSTVDKYLKQNPERENLLNSRQCRHLETIRLIYAQQWEMFKSRTHTVKDRIVSIHMPHIRPIVRGKAGAEVEFGAKILSTVVNGFSFPEHISFDTFNEGTMLKQAVENYKARYGFYPKSVMADQIFRSRENNKWLHERNIRISGPPLGRKSKSVEITKALKLQARIDSGIRNQVESSYGVMKRKYSLDKVPTRLKETTESFIALMFLVKNLDHRLRLLFVRFFKKLFYPKYLRLFCSVRCYCA